MKFGPTPIAEALDAITPDNPLYAQLGVWRDAAPGSVFPRAQTEATSARLERLGVRCPAFDQALFDRTLDWLRARASFPEPDALPRS